MSSEQELNEGIKSIKSAWRREHTARCNLEKMLEQAKTENATLMTGLRAQECTLESMHGYCDPYVRTAYVVELSCHTLDAWDDPVPPSYCPYCGKRVVKEN